MTAIKNKTIKPAAKSLAPATKVAVATKSSSRAAPVAKKTVVSMAKPATKPAAKPAAKVAKKNSGSVAPVPAVKPVPTKPVVTSITANIDIGFGNALYVRGEGAGLSWDRGTLMTCVTDSQWQIALGESARPIVFKFLVNDLSWSAGEDYSVSAGGTVSVVPTF